MKTFTVVSVTPESSPPNTPAMHIGPSASAMTMSVASSLRVRPSRVTMGSSWAARRTMTLPPRILSASKVCRGWPVSKRMKLEMSTTLLMGRRPMERSFFCSHSGDGATVTPFTVMPVYRGAPFVSSTSTGMASPSPSWKASTDGMCRLHGMSRDFRYAYTSRATPMWEAASMRFAVISYSITDSSLRFRYFFAGVPTTASAGSTMMPSWEAPMPSSSSAQIMPKDSTPRILLFLILKSPGSTVPMRAKRTFWPAATFGAPQTTVTGSGEPSLTVVMCRWSESGWGMQVSTSATTTPASPPGISSWNSTLSTSMPIEVIASATCSAVRSHSRYSLSQL